MAGTGTLEAACAHFARQLGIEWPEHVSLCFQLFTPEQYANLVLKVALVSVLTEIRNELRTQSCVMTDTPTDHSKPSDN